MSPSNTFALSLSFSLSLLFLPLCPSVWGWSCIEDILWPCLAFHSCWRSLKQQWSRLKLSLYTYKIVIVMAIVGFSHAALVCFFGVLVGVIFVVAFVCWSLFSLYGRMCIILNVFRWIFSGNSKWFQTQFSLFFNQKCPQTITNHPSMLPPHHFLSPSFLLSFLACHSSKFSISKQFLLKGRESLNYALAV